ncbi:MAG: inner membrane CreD family protein, partial [Bacteroidales bacterium]|nr:inner membrane CreD family protein [Bacteroidales bacterium]
METTNLFNKSSLKMPLRIGIGALLTLFLMLPLSMIESLILERQSNYEQVSFEIGRDWGGQQTISGPFLIVPVKKGALNQIVEYYNENGKEKRRIQDSKIVISPKDLKINADIKPQSKHKGIYNFVVYNSDITVEGNFSEIDLSDIRI